MVAELSSRGFSNGKLLMAEEGTGKLSLPKKRGVEGVHNLPGNSGQEKRRGCGYRRNVSLDTYPNRQCPERGSEEGGGAGGAGGEGGEKKVREEKNLKTESSRNAAGGNMSSTSTLSDR